jgi:hypothetical protein
MLRATVLALAVSFLLAATASAQSPLPGIRARYVAGDFQGTLTASEVAERETTLDREELLAMLELRTLAQRALGDEAAADQTLRLIAAIDPDRELGAEMPPVLRARFASLAAAVGSPPRIEARPRVDGATFRLSSQLADDPAHVIRRLELRARTSGGEWVSAVDGPLTLPASPGARVEWEARALGPADAEIAVARGTETIPGGSGADDVTLWAVVGVTVGLALVGAVIAIVLFSLGTGVDTEVDGPVITELRF